MQHAQGNYKPGTLAALLVVVLFFVPKTAFSAGLADRGTPDPILATPRLSGEDKGPCDPRTAPADLTPDTDVEGNPVTPADLDRSRVPLPGHMIVHLKSGSYLTVDGSKLDPLLNPETACH